MALSVTRPFLCLRYCTARLHATGAVPNPAIPGIPNRYFAYGHSTADAMGQLRRRALSVRRSRERSTASSFKPLGLCANRRVLRPLTVQPLVGGRDAK